ncbi:hypothetical protein G6F65_014555 [Rhizopus arrhizus]|nr:hypothetical protein G6F65_014555 [Rhizopus arrhizus]
MGVWQGWRGRTVPEIAPARCLLLTFPPQPSQPTPRKPRRSGPSQYGPASQDTLPCPFKDARMFRHSALRSAALALAVSLCLGVPSAFADNAPAASASTAVQREAVAKGLYELAYSPKQNAVFVPSSGGFGDDAGPAQVLRLNPTTLAVETRIPLERKAFGVVLDDAHNRLYVGNTVDLSVTVVDTAQNKAIGTIQLMEKKTGKDGKAAYTHDLRELVVDSAGNRLYVTGHSSQPDVSSVLFVIDTTTLKVINTIDGLGNAKAPGLALDAANKRVYTSNLLADLVVVGTDSHTPHSGALGCVAFGVGTTDMANAFVTGAVRLTMPASLRVDLAGALPPGVTAKDIVLHLLALPEIRSGAGVGKVFEFTGDAIAGLSVDERATLTNMTAELGGLTGIVAPDAETVRFLRERRGVDVVIEPWMHSDPDAVYAATLRVDCQALSPLVAAPGDPGNGIPLSSLQARPRIDSTYN